MAKYTFTFSTTKENKLLKEKLVKRGVPVSPHVQDAIKKLAAKHNIK